MYVYMEITEWKNVKNGVKKREHSHSCSSYYSTVQTFVVLCSRQLIGPADWVFVTLGPLRCD